MEKLKQKYNQLYQCDLSQIAGCGLLGFGVYTRTNDSRVARFSSIVGSYLYSTLSLLLIIGGGVVILLSFLGCCGAIKEVRCMLGSVRNVLFVTCDVYTQVVNNVLLRDG